MLKSIGLTNYFQKTFYTYLGLYLLPKTLINFIEIQSILYRKKLDTGISEHPIYFESYEEY